MRLNCAFARQLRLPELAELRRLNLTTARCRKGRARATWAFTRLCQPAHPFPLLETACARSVEAMQKRKQSCVCKIAKQVGFGNIQ